MPGRRGEGAAPEQAQELPVFDEMAQGVRVRYRGLPVTPLEVDPGEEREAFLVALGSTDAAYLRRVAAAEASNRRLDPGDHNISLVLEMMVRAASIEHKRRVEEAGAATMTKQQAGEAGFVVGG